MAKTRIPTQKRSIEKREKIIEIGFKLICEKGYFNISTPDIAKAANVSTGIIYQYFSDKKDIFIEGIKNYSQSIMFPMLDMIDNKEIKFNNKNMEIFLAELINYFIENHTISKKAHEELMAMTHLDNDISDIFKETEIAFTNKIVNFLNKNNINITNPTEKIHISIGIVENLCHEIVYHQHDNINYETMKQEVIHIIINLLNH